MPTFSITVSGSCPDEAVARAAAERMVRRLADSGAVMSATFNGDVLADLPVPAQPKVRATKRGA